MNYRNELDHHLYRTPVQHHCGDFASNVEVKVSSFLPHVARIRIKVGIFFFSLGLGDCFSFLTTMK